MHQGVLPEWRGTRPDLRGAWERGGMQAVQGSQGGGGGALHVGGGGQGGLHLDQPVLVRLPAGVYGPLLNGLQCN